MTEITTTRVDRRVSRTRRQLKEALFALIHERGYDAVTIEDITQRADLGRTTFYLHYRDKEGLLLAAIKVIADDLIRQILPIPDDGWKYHENQNGVNLNDPIMVVFKHAANNAMLYQIILSGEVSTKATASVHAIISDVAARVINQTIADGNVTMKPVVPVDVFANYLAGALLGTLNWWLISGCQQTPEEMTVMFRKMIFQGGVSVLGLDPA
jgi:AcrR family transcriptional regulator